MKDSFIISIIGVIGFLLVAFTSIVPVTLNSYEITNVFIVKATVGFLSLICGYMVVWGLFHSEHKVKQPREGKLRLRPLFLVVGIFLICVAWFTNIPLFIAEFTGLSNTFDYGGELLQGGIGTRIFVSIFTGFGVLFIRFAWYRRKEYSDHQTEQSYRRLRKRGEGVE